MKTWAVLVILVVGAFLVRRKRKSEKNFKSGRYQTFSVSHLGNFKEAAARYSQAEVVKIESKRISGNPAKELISTSHVEKQNHTLRMHCRRLTRVTKAFSKKLENFEAAIALNFTYYNFCKLHGAVRCTPAMAAGVESSQWSVAELVERCGE